MKAEKRNCTAVILAAGAGKRMNSSTRKQFLHIKDRPVLFYTLRAFQNSFIDRIVLVAPLEEAEYCRREIVEKYGFTKVDAIVPGGRERYHSVAAGLKELTSCDYVFIHDGARPVITEEILQRAYEAVCVHGACAVGVPSKDTVKIADREGFIQSTPDRRLVWNIQTPQVFSCSLIRKAYEELLQKESMLSAEGISVTDDAMVVETLLHHPVKLVEGSYENIKITTPEDLRVAELLLS